MGITEVSEVGTASVVIEVGAGRPTAPRLLSRQQLLVRGCRALVALAGVVATLVATSNVAAAAAAPVASKAVSTDIRAQVYFCNVFRLRVSRTVRANPYYYNSYTYAKCQYLYRHYGMNLAPPPKLTVKTVLCRWAGVTSPFVFAAIPIPAAILGGLGLFAACG